MSTIESPVTQDPAIHFTLFIPRDQPLFITDENGQPLKDTNAFLVPQWGGLVVRNIDNQTLLNSTSSPVPVHLTSVALRPILSTFLFQLRELVGVVPFDTFATPEQV